MTQVILQPGMVVTVQPEIPHPGLGISLGGWHGRIVDIKRMDADETYVAVAWDSQTLAAQPADMIRYLVDADWEWRGWVFTPEQLLPAAPRDTEADVEQIAARIEAEVLAKMGPSIHAKRDVYELYFDAVDWGDEEDEPEDFFDVELFLDVLHISEEERETIHDALAQGLGAYYRQYYGVYRYGKRPYFLIPSKLTDAPIFGHAALAVIEHPHISAESKQKIAYFACQTSDPFATNHIPYALVSFVSFLAAQDALSLDLFRGVMLALELGSNRHENFVGWSLPYAQQLSAWLLDHPQMPLAEKQWWLWHIGANLDGQYYAKIGKALIPQWFAAAQLPMDTRQELAWSWVWSVDSVGTPPLNWQLMQATFSGDAEAAEAIAQAMELNTQMDVSEEEILADLEKTPHIAPMPDHHGPGNDPVGFLRMLMSMRFGGFFRIPAYIRSLAVVALLTMGEDVELVAEEVFALQSDSDAAFLQEGLALGLLQLREQVPSDLLHSLVERGVTEAKASARKQFYQLGMTHFGEDYRERAVQDPAKSVRAWAAKLR